MVSVDELHHCEVAACEKVGRAAKDIHKNLSRGNATSLPVKEHSGLVFKAHRPVYHSTLGWRVIQKKRKKNIP